jgi:hypothetical protein
MRRRAASAAPARSPLRARAAQSSALPSDLRSGVEQPVVIEIGQEVALVFGDGPDAVQDDLLVITRRRRGQDGIAFHGEDAQVDPARGGITPAEVRGGDHQRWLAAQDAA